jgi:hypothetical protein
MILVTQNLVSKGHLGLQDLTQKSFDILISLAQQSDPKNKPVVNGIL